MKTNLIIETSQDFFCNWLEDFTRDAPYMSFPTEKGRISLQAARPAQFGYSGNRYMRMEGYYITAKGDGEIAYPLSNVVEFKIIPLHQNRIEVAAVCSQHVVENYFQLLLQEISKRWPPIKSPEQQIFELQETVTNSLRQSQDVLTNIQARLDQVLGAVRDGQIEQGEVSRTLDAIRRVLRFMQKQDAVLSREVTEQVNQASEVVDSKIEIQQKVELTIPILPLFLSYKAEFGIGNDVDIENLYSEVQARLSSLIEKSSKGS